MPSFPIPRVFKEKIIEILKNRISKEILKRSDSFYRNPWFLVKKIDDNYRLINATMKMNRITVRDANMPSNADEFLEKFAGCAVISLINFFSEYD